LRENLRNMGAFKGTRPRLHSAASRSKPTNSDLEARGASSRDHDVLVDIIDGLLVVVAGLDGLEDGGAVRLDLPEDPERRGVAVHHAGVHGLVQFLLQLRELHNARTGRRRLVALLVVAC
jgi:hypothetical protein